MRAEYGRCQHCETQVSYLSPHTHDCEQCEAKIEKSVDDLLEENPENPAK
jgi:PHP family Zn ribbon phosphoesterase